MPAFHPLPVAEVRAETDEAVSIRFDVPAALVEDYRYTPGQHLTLRRFIDGEELRRTYSICSALDDAELRVAVKRMPFGRFSTWATTELVAGDLVDVMTPVGRFTVTADPATERHLVGLAGGSGITPIFSILRSVLAREPRSRFTLVYGNRNERSVIFGDALADCKNRYLDRLHLVHVLEDEVDVPMLQGLLTEDKTRDLLHAFVDPARVDGFLICGPGPMTMGVRAALLDLGIEAARIHVELFDTPGAAPPASSVREPVAASASPDGGRLTVILGGTKTELGATPDTTVLEAALAAGLDLPYSCRAGVCATCRAKLVDGTVSMAANYALEPWEVAAGYVLTCQSRPTSERVVVDYDQT